MKKGLLYKLLPYIEVIDWVLVCVGFGLMWALRPAGSRVFLAGMLALATSYFLEAFKPSPPANAVAEEFSGAQTALPPETSGPFLMLKSILLKLLNISAAVVLVGILYKLLFFPGSRPLLLTGTVTLAIAAGLLAPTDNLAKKHALVLVLGLATWATDSETLVRQFHRDDPVLVEKLIFSLHHPYDKAAAEDLRKYRQAKPSG